MSSSFFDSLFRHTHYAVFVCDPDGRLVEANPALARVLGFASPEALLAARDVRLDPIPQHARETGAATDATSSAEAPHDSDPAVDGVRWIETRWHRRDGTPVSVRMALRTVRNESGVVQRYEAIAEDITERRRAEELRRRHDRLSTIGTTLAGAAHELNNPLAAIMGFAQWLMKKPWPDEDRMALETISHEAERSARIVKDLLTLARRRETERRSPVNLNDVAGYIVGTRRYAFEAAGIACELRLDPALPLVCGDRAQLEQVVLNLVNNAEQALRAQLDAADRHASPPGGPQIAVRTRREGAEVLLEVDDNGPGIAESARSRIWDPFWTTRGEQQGTGLGLSVVHHLVVEHGGSVDVGDSILPGGGASFRVRLPASSDQEATRDPASAPPASRALDILVLAIDPTDRSFLTRFLTSRGHVVLSTADLERARRYAEQTSFDAVVIDLGLAGGEPAVAERLRVASGCRSARFVVTSSAARTGAMPDDSLHARLAGWGVVLAKPFDVALLRRAIEER